MASTGPFRPHQVGEDDRYELSRGHPIHSAPAGGRHGREQLVGALPIATDPMVTEAGIDVGYAPDEHTLRAPDIAVGNVPNKPGWVAGAPVLAVEYADRGIDEDDLQQKIGELLGAGTKLVWVVRLTGPRRVDVHAPQKPPLTVAAGGSLDAEGILSRPMPVDALFDRERANQVALDNLLRAYGYDGVDRIRAEGHAEGHAQGHAAGRAEGQAQAVASLRLAIDTLCSVLGIALDQGQRALVDGADLQTLTAMLTQLREHRRFE